MSDEKTELPQALAEFFEVALMNLGTAYHLWRFENQHRQPRDPAAVALREMELEEAWEAYRAALYPEKSS